MYSRLDAAEPLAQGEIIDECPILAWIRQDGGWTASESIERVIVLTQACDLENSKTTRVQVAVVHEAGKLVDAGILKGKLIEDSIRRHKVYGWYFLPTGPGLPESIVDLRDIHTVPSQLLIELIRSGKRVVAVLTPYREHLAQHFTVTYARIGLPEPYGTE